MLCDGLQHWNPQLDLCHSCNYCAESSPESINDNLALDTLDWVYHHSHSSWVELLKALQEQQQCSNNAATSC